jgi:hypothetical protein
MILRLVCTLTTIQSPQDGVHGVQLLSKWKCTFLKGTANTLSFGSKGGHTNVFKVLKPHSCKLLVPNLISPQIDMLQISDVPVR